MCHTHYLGDLFYNYCLMSVAFPKPLRNLSAVSVDVYLAKTCLLMFSVNIESRDI